MAMQLFVDESGGWIGKDRNSPHSHFTLAAVLIETDEMVAACTDAIVQVRTRNQLGDNFEFHFTKITEVQRIAFFSAISNCPFYYAACTIDNNRIKGDAWKEKPYFYEKAIAPVVESLGIYLRVAQASLGKALCAKLTYDTCHDPVFQETLDAQFRKLKDSKGRSLVEKVRAGVSRTSDLIQLADMVCGSAVRFYLEGSTVYRDYIKQKEERHHTLP
jgi:hypothetical protein